MLGVSSPLVGQRANKSVLTEGYDRIPAQRLLDEGVDIRQSFAVVEVRQPVVPYHAVQLGLRFLLNVRIQKHRQEEAAQRGHSLEKTGSHRVSR